MNEHEIKMLVKKRIDQTLLMVKEAINEEAEIKPEYKKMLLDEIDSRLSSAGKIVGVFNNMKQDGLRVIKGGKDVEAMLGGKQ